MAHPESFHEQLAVSPDVEGVQNRHHFSRIAVIGALVGSSLGFGGGSIDALDTGKTPANSSDCMSHPALQPGDTALLNVVSVQADGPGWISARASDEIAVYKRPDSDKYSNGNFTKDSVIPNMAPVLVGSDGKFCIDNAISANYPIVDLFGKFPAGSGYVAIDPTRLLDRRPVQSTTRIDRIPHGTDYVSPEQIIFECFYKIEKFGGNTAYPRRVKFRISGLNPDTNPDPSVSNGDRIDSDFEIYDDAGALWSVFGGSLFADENGSMVVEGVQYTFEEEAKVIRNDKLKLATTTKYGVKRFDEFLVNSICAFEGIVQY